MVGRIRKALFWLLLLALPLHGVAGGTMKNCIDMPMPVVRASSDCIAAHDAVASTGSIEQAGDQLGEPCGPMANARPAKSSSCVASAACGLVAAPAATTALLITAVVDTAPADPPAAPHAAFFTGAPERPPRLSA